MKTTLLTLAFTAAFVTTSVYAKDNHSHGAVSDQAIAKQRAMLETKTNGRGFGPQSPRDLASSHGTNLRAFSIAPASSKMNLCNIHLHKNAEHKGGEFTKYAGNGDGTGYETGFKYSGQLTSKETKAINKDICPSPHGGLYPGDTIEVHYVHSSAQAKPGYSLGSCLGDSTMNPEVRVETQVFVVVNDESALDFNKLTKHALKDGYHQALNIPSDTGTPIQYTGSTTGPKYNQQASNIQVTWSVRPKVAKVNIETVGKWCKGNTFKEDHAHGVRNLVVNPKLLSAM
jgi:hypothetical protein